VLHYSPMKQRRFTFMDIICSINHNGHVELLTCMFSTLMTLAELCLSWPRIPVNHV